MDNQGNTQFNTQEERDLMDGGFAVVDREKLIEEEIRETTPWYKNFINAFLAPRKMMEDCFYQQPPKGIGMAVMGAVIFGMIYSILVTINPISKEMAYNQLRMKGISENMLHQTFTYSLVGSAVGGVIGIFIGALITTILLKITTLIAKDKAKFSRLFTVALLSTMVSTALLCIDAIIGNIIPTIAIVMGPTVFFTEGAVITDPVLYAVASCFTIPNLWKIVILIVGYSVVTGANMKKSTISVLIMEMISDVIGISFTAVLLNFQNSMIM